MRNTARVKSLVVLILALAAGAAQAAPMLRYAPAPAPSTSTSLYDKGLLALNEKDINGAIKFFQQAAQAEPKSPAPLLGMAEVARLNNQPAEVAQWIGKAEKVAPDDPTTKLASARLQFAQGKYELAAARLNAIVATDPKSQGALLDLGEIYSTVMPQPDKAAKAFSQVLTLTPDHAGAHFGLGNAYLHLGELKKAQTEFETALKLAPDNSLPLMGISEVQSAAGNYNEAIATLLKVQQKNPKSPRVYVSLGGLYQLTKQFPAAYKAYLQAVELAPKDPQSYNNLAWMAAERKERLEDAVRWATKATTLAPKNLQLRDTLAWVKRAQGKTEEAQVILEDIVKQRDATPEHYYHLGMVRAERGQKAAAVEAMQQALKRAPKYKEAADALKRLQATG